MKKRIMSAVTPSGNIHLGNYIGSIKQWVSKQDVENNDNWFSIADLHALTTPKDPKIVREKTLQIMMLYLACGLDPQKSTVFVQSHVSAHAELTWLLNCVTPIGWMNQMIQFKEKSAKLGDESVSVGLFDYPVLMASDILLYQTDLVPVGEDQRQHVEIAREIARRFNRLFGNTFKEPETVNPPQGARVMALDNPLEKMSKSAESKYNYIALLDSPDEIRQKIGRAVTDSQSGIVFDNERKGLFNLLTIYQVITDQSKEEIENKYADKGYADFKNDLAEIIVEYLRPIREKYDELDKNKDYVMQLMAHGASKASAVANETLNKAKQKSGLLLPLTNDKLAEKPLIGYDEWSKMDIRIATVLSAEEVEGADKLYKLSIDFGNEKRTLIAGIKQHYSIDDLVGKQIPILANLQPREIKGIESRGMILAIGDDDRVVLLHPEKAVKNGCSIG